MKIFNTFQQFLNEKKPAGAPDWHDSDAPDAEGRFKDLSPKDLAAWLIKTRKKDLRKISGSLNQQIVFNRNEDPDYAEKMEKTRQEVYKQLGREDLMDSKQTNDNMKHIKPLNEAPAFGQHKEHDYSDKMSYGQLERCMDYAKMIRERIEAGQSLDPWMHSQIAVAENELNSVFDALDGDDGVVEAANIQYKVAGRPVTLKQGEKSDGTDWKVVFKNGKEVDLSEVLALIKPFPPITESERKWNDKRRGPHPYTASLSDGDEKKKEAQMKKQAKMDDEDSDAYKELPGDKKARTKGKVKTSKHVKSYHELYGDDKTDESVVNEEKAKGDRGPIDDDKIETALKKKKEETGVPMEFLRIVMRRGMAAWKTGHRPGATQQQWGYSRLNSFLTKQPGTWGGADSDVAKEVRDGGHDKKLKKA